MLNGAPRREHLDFSDSCLLPADVCNAFSLGSIHTASKQDSTPAMKWRCIAKKNTRLQTEWQQPYLPGSLLGSHMADVSLPEVERFASFANDDTTKLDATLDFNDPTMTCDGLIEHSLIFHDTLMSSQVALGEGPTTTISSSSFLDTSFDTTTSGCDSPGESSQRLLVRHIPPKLSITPLASLPSAQKLRAIYPQTPTPNFVCVVTANPEMREVFVRKRGYKMDLWEIMVADDSLSGFKIAFWMRPPCESKEHTHVQSSLLETLQGLKVGDIILSRNIALTSFRDTVFGQSLNPAITRVRTHVDVLMKSNGSSAVHSGKLPAPVDEAFARVKKWARIHIASDSAGPRKRKGSVPKDDYVKRPFEASTFDASMPPDTLESI